MNQKEIDEQKQKLLDEKERILTNRLNRAESVLSLRNHVSDNPLFADSATDREVNHRLADTLTNLNAPTLGDEKSRLSAIEHELAALSINETLLDFSSLSEQHNAAYTNLVTEFDWSSLADIPKTPVVLHGTIRDFTSLTAPVGYRDGEFDIFLSVKRKGNDTTVSNDSDIVNHQLDDTTVNGIASVLADLPMFKPRVDSWTDNDVKNAYSRFLTTVEHNPANYGFDIPIPKLTSWMDKEKIGDHRVRGLIYAYHCDRPKRECNAKPLSSCDEFGNFNGTFGRT